MSFIKDEIQNKFYQRDKITEDYAENFAKELVINKYVDMKHPHNYYVEKITQLTDIFDEVAHQLKVHQHVIDESFGVIDHHLISSVTLDKSLREIQLEISKKVLNDLLCNDIDTLVKNVAIEEEENPEYEYEELFLRRMLLPRYFYWANTYDIFAEFTEDLQNSFNRNLKVFWNIELKPRIEKFHNELRKIIDRYIRQLEIIL